MTTINQLTCKFLILCLLLATFVFEMTIANEQDAEETTIPVELQVIMAGWEDNFGKIHSINAKAQLRTDDVKFLKCKDYEGKSYKSQNSDFEIWKDGPKLRSDIVIDRTFDFDNNKVKYNLPFGEYVMPSREWAQKKEEIERKHGVTQTTLKVLRLADKQCNYFVESKDVTIDKTVDYFPGPNACEWITEGRIFYGVTFPEYIKDKAKLPSTKSFEVEDLGGGRYAVYENFNGTTKEKEFAGRTRIVVNASQGYTIESYTRKAEDSIIYDAEYKYAKKGNAWVIVGGYFKRYDWMGQENKVKSTVSLTVDADTLKVNEPIDPKVFTFESLNILKGSLVRDSIEDKEYLFNDVPIHLKVSLAKAQDYIENLSLNDFEDVEVQEYGALSQTPAPLSGEKTVPEVKKNDSDVTQNNGIEVTDSNIEQQGSSLFNVVLLGVLIIVAIIMLLFWWKKKKL